jgi:hypothetical protein
VVALRRVLLAILCTALAACGVGAASVTPATQATAIGNVTMPPVAAAPTVTPAVATSTAAVTPAPTAELPSPTFRPTPKPTAGRTPARQSTPGPDRTGMLGSVLADTLRVRSKPSISDDSIKYEPLLKQGTRFGYIAGPVAASGYQWYLVDLGSDSPLLDGVTQGWVAAGDRDGTPWIDAAID